MRERFHLHENVVGPHGPGTIVRVQQTGEQREYLVGYRDGRTLVSNGADLNHTFRALHPGLLGGSCANCFAPSGMHGKHQACVAVDAEQTLAGDYGFPRILAVASGESPQP